MGPFFKPVQVPPDGTPSFCHLNCTVQLGVISRLAEDALNLIISVIDKDAKEYWTQDGHLGYTALYQPPLCLLSL